ncbi:MAG: ATP phosphoribosyltransferase [Candidatus Helarchaeota archaeon]|nr:ATP phosphoribosyltransferase [Candidatus Helarchaeota archaeon]
MSKLKFAIPKGSLQDGTLKLFRQAGYNIAGGTRSYRPSINDPEIELKILRPQEIPTMLQESAHDIGISGEDWVKETSADVVKLLDLEYGYVRLVLAVPEDWIDINGLSDLLKKKKSQDKPLRIFTEYLSSSSQYIQKNEFYQELFGNSTPEIITPWYKSGTNPKVKLILSFGATEAKPPEDADGIIDVIETGTTLIANNLKIIELISESNAYLLGNKKALRDPWKKEKIKDVMVVLKGVVEARKKLHIFLNIKNENIPMLLDRLPALKRPTISPLAGVEGWSALNTIIPKDIFLKLIPELRKYAQGIVINEPRQILPFELKELNNADLTGEDND